MWESVHNYVWGVNRNDPEDEKEMTSQDASKQSQSTSTK